MFKKPKTQPKIQPKTQPKTQKVQVWIKAERTQNVLLLLTIPKRGSIWQPITGHVEKNETLMAAALREAMEETGIPDIANYRMEELGKSFTFEKHGVTFCEQAFLLTLPKEISIKLDPHEHTDYKWTPIDKARLKLPYINQIEILNLIK